MELVTGHQATPHITAEQVSRLLQGVTTMDDTTVYRLPIRNNCAVSVSSLDVSIDTGEIVLHGFHTTFEEGYTVTLDPTIDAAKSRIDKIVMEIIEDLTTGIQTANIEVVQGEESSSPVAPATPVAPTSPTEKFLAVGVIAKVTVSNITIASFVDNTELYAGSYISEETFSKTVRNQSSDQYNTTKAYKVGDYVIHNDTLYKCITACSAGSWEANQNCFVTDTLTNTVTTLNSDLSTLNSTLATITTNLNNYQLKEWTYVGRVTYDYGKAVPATAKEIAYQARSPYYEWYGIIPCVDSAKKNISHSGVFYNGNFIDNQKIAFHFESNAVWLDAAIQDGQTNTSNAYIEVWYR